MPAAGTRPRRSRAGVRDPGAVGCVGRGGTVPPLRSGVATTLASVARGSTRSGEAAGPAGGGRWPITSRRGLQLALGAIGTVATVAGSDAVLRGAAQVLDGGDASANLDTELRFYASWYVVFGVLMLRAARRPEAETTTVRACGAGFLLAAFGRAVSSRAVGRPHPLFQVLMAMEAAIPVVLIPWQRRVRSLSAGGAVEMTPGRHVAPRRVTATRS